MSSHFNICRTGTGRFTKVVFCGDHWIVWIKSRDFVTGWFLRLYANGRQEVCYTENGVEKLVEIKQVQEQ